MYKIMENPPTAQKTPKIYDCKCCEFTTKNKKDYGKHLLTAKHLKSVKNEEMIMNANKHPFQCICGSKYKHKSGLCRHKNVCKAEAPLTQTNSSEELKELKTILLDIMKNTNEMQQKLLTLCNKE